jgi:hypothetical protein
VRPFFRTLRKRRAVAAARREEHRVRRLLLLIQARLGSPHEQPNDIEAAGHLVHRLISLAQAIACPLPPPMKSKNSFYSFLRHAAGVIGGSLVGNPDPRLAALGWALGALATSWGVSDEFKAENPGMKPPAGNGHVGMILFCFLAASVCTTFTGCASGSGAKATPAQLEARAYALVNTAGVVIAHDNPELAGEIQRIAAGVDAVFEKGVLTPEQLKAFLGALNVPEDKRLLVAVGVNNAYELYKAETGQELIDVSNPVAAAILRGVKRGITDAIALTQAFQPKTSMLFRTDAMPELVSGFQPAPSAMTCELTMRDAVTGYSGLTTSTLKWEELSPLQQEEVRRWWRSAGVGEHMPAEWAAK